MEESLATVTCETYEVRTRSWACQSTIAFVALRRRRVGVLHLATGGQGSLPGAGGGRAHDRGQAGRFIASRPSWSLASPHPPGSKPGSPAWTGRAPHSLCRRSSVRAEATKPRSASHNAAGVHGCGGGSRPRPWPAHSPRGARPGPRGVRTHPLRVPQTPRIPGPFSIWSLPGLAEVLGRWEVVRDLRSPASWLMTLRVAEDHSGVASPTR